MQLQKYLIWPWVFDLDPRSRSHEALPSTSCDLCTCTVWSCYGQWLRRCITKKIHYLTLTPRSRGSMSYKMFPSTLDIMWPMHQQCVILLRWLRRRHIYKKINYLTFGSRSHKMLPSTLYIMWPMHQQSLILLHPKFKEKMHLQENTLCDLDQKVKITRNVAQCPLHHVNYAPTEFEVTTSKGLGEEAFTRKFNIWLSTLGQGHTKCCPVPSTSSDLFSYKVWSCYV